MTELNYHSKSKNVNAMTDQLVPPQIPLGEAYPILGQSYEMIQLKKQIEFAAKADLPVFISGENGTEKRSVAYHIHSHSHRSDQSRGSFVYVPSNIHDLASYRSHLNNGIDQAEKGTLYLSEVDHLNTMQKDYLIALFTLDSFQETLRKQCIRLIISCTDPLLSQKSSQQFLAKLLGSATPHLALNVPPLRDRAQDIRQHVEHILSQFSVSFDIRITAEAMSLLVHYNWPGNVTQLQQLLMVLASYSQGEINASDVRLLDVIKAHSSSLDVIDIILEKRFDALQHVHPALLKALVFMSDNFREDISLTDVAGAAFTSPSHLSYLFREHLHHSFKVLLVQVRVRYSQRQIDLTPMMKITDICLHSGFGDLSHFEKMFKRHVGCTPRQYRQQIRQANRLAQAS
jgi:DNA-binding NtrC family response regulator